MAPMSHHLAVLSCLATLALAACSRGPSPAERAAAAQARIVAQPPVDVGPAVPVVTTPPASPVSLNGNAVAPVPDTVAEAAERQQIADHLYREMDPKIPDKDRREAAWVMAGDLIQMGREANGQDGATPAERSRREQEIRELQIAQAQERKCAELRGELEVKRQFLRDRPRDRITPEQSAVIEGEIAATEARLPQLCP